MKGSNWVPGVKKDQSVYYSELVIIDGILSVLKVIVDFYKIRSGSIELAVDEEQAMDQANDAGYLYTSQKSFNIIYMIFVQGLKNFLLNKMETCKRQRIRKRTRARLVDVSK